MLARMGKRQCKEGADPWMNSENGACQQAVRRFYANRDINLSVRGARCTPCWGRTAPEKHADERAHRAVPAHGGKDLPEREGGPHRLPRPGGEAGHRHGAPALHAGGGHDGVREHHPGGPEHPGIFIDREARRKEILELAERYGLDVELDRPITEIAVGAQQRVEILKTLYRGAELLILDEPTAALTDIEVEGLFKIIRKLTRRARASSSSATRCGRCCRSPTASPSSAPAGGHHPGPVRDGRPGAGQPDDRPGAVPLPL